MNRVLLFLVLAALLLAALHWLTPGPVARAYLGSARLAAGMSSDYLETDGQIFHYLEAGNGPTLVLVHGFGGDADNWLLVARALAKRHRVIAIDLPGFGSSPAPEDGSYAVADQAARLATFIQALNAGRVHVAGNSMGGQIVTVLAASRSNLVRSVALLDPLGVEGEQGVQASVTMQKLGAGENVLLPPDDASFAAMMSLMFYREPWVPGVMKRYYRKKWLASLSKLGDVFADINDHYIPLAPLLPELDAPVLVIWGANDDILPASGANVLAAGLRHSKVVIIPECGHLPMIEKPRVTAAHYLEFLDGLPPD